MVDRTNKHIVLNDHIRRKDTLKSVCVSTCMDFFGICINSYRYTSTNKNRYAYINVLRKFGYSVRSKKTEFKVKTNGITLTSLRKNIIKSVYGTEHFFIVHLIQKKSSHLIVLNGDGSTVIDTAKNMRWKVTGISIVEKI